MSIRVYGEFFEGERRISFLFEQQLIVFREVAETNNITLAAKKLHMSQPSISLQIQNLEEQYGIRFFDRSNKGVTLTQAGKIFNEKVREMLNILEETQHQVSAIYEDKRGLIQLGATLTIGEYILPHILGYLNRQRPDMDVKIKIANTLTIDQNVLEQQLNIGLIEGPLPKHKKFYAEKFWEDELVVVVPTSHPWANYDKISLEELPKERFVTREVGSGTRKVMEMALKERGFDPSELNITMELGSTEAIKQVVSAGLGFTIISALTVRKECDQKIFKALRIQDSPLYRPLSIITLAQSPQTKEEEFFINLLRDRQLLSEILDQDYCSDSLESKIS